MDSCCTTDSEGRQSDVQREQAEFTKLATQAHVVMSFDDEKLQDTGSLVPETQNDETEFTSAECEECPRLSSSDSRDEEMSSCDLLASELVLNTTFIVEVDSLDNYTSPVGLLDAKTVLTIAYDVEDSAVVQKRNGNETFVQVELKDDFIHRPEIHRFANDSGNALPAVTAQPASLSADRSSDHDAGCNYDRRSSDADMEEGKVGVHGSNKLPCSEVANDERDSSPFELEEDQDIDGETGHFTSTPLKLPVANYSGNNVDTAMMKCNDENHSNVNILNASFVISPLQEDSQDQFFVDVGSEYNKTFLVGESADGEPKDCDWNLADSRRFTAVRYSSSKAGKFGVQSLMENSLKHDSSFTMQSSTDEQNGISMNDDDLSMSNIDVFKDDSNASFFVTEWPSVLTGYCHDLLLSAALQQNIPLAQTEAVSSPLCIRVVVDPADSSPDLISEWTFSSMMGQFYPSFDGRSVDGLDEDSVRQHSSMQCSSNASRLSELDEQIQQLHSSGKFNLKFST